MAVHPRWISFQLIINGFHTIYFRSLCLIATPGHSLCLRVLLGLRQHWQFEGKEQKQSNVARQGMHTITGEKQFSYSSLKEG